MDAPLTIAAGWERYRESMAAGPGRKWSEDQLKSLKLAFFAGASELYFQLLERQPVKELGSPIQLYAGESLVIGAELEAFALACRDGRVP